MIENIWFIAAFWMGLALVASLVSIRLGISVALIEILVGVIVGNIHFGQYHNLLRTTEWTNFLAMLGSGVLTFLAGAEIRSEERRVGEEGRYWRDWSSDVYSSDLHSLWAVSQPAADDGVDELSCHAGERRADVPGRSGD